MGSPQRSVLVDPLSDFSLVSLFPRTFNQRDPDPDPRHNDLLEAVSAHLESMMLKNPNTLLEQAKSILDGKIESLSVNNLEIVTDEDTVGDLGGVNNANLQGDTENPENPRAVDSMGDVLGVNHEKLQVRRPALGRKKARFALKQKSSQSMETLEPFVDIDKLPDPEEFFLALEKHENAKNELRRQSGKALMDIDQNVPYMTERRRRPGLLSKSASYKHRFSTAPSGDDKAFFSSQEKLSQDLCSPAPSNNSLQTEHTGPKNTVKTRPDGISEELQSCEDKDDDNDEIIGMLQERFKPIEIDKSCLPELNSVLQSEFMTLGESLQDSQDKMSDLQGFVSAIGKATTLSYNNLERSSGHPSTLPRPPKSPYASISSLKARLFQSRKENDPFLALDIDLSPVRNAASCKDTHDLAARDLENTIKNVNMPNLSSANRIHVESAHATGDNDARETNPNSPVHESEVSKDIQDLAAAKFTSSGNNIGDSMVPDVPSDSTGHMELEDDIVENAERDINPKSTVLEKESDTARTMKTAKDISKTLGVCSDSLVHIESHHSIRRDQRSESAARDKESNVVHTMDIRDFDAENLPLSTEIRKDNSMSSDIALNTTPHVEMDHDITANNMRGGVLEHNTSDVCDGAAKSADEHIEPNGKVPEENVLGSNVEKSNCYKEQSTVNAVENLEKNGRSSNLDELPIASVTGEPDHDRPSSSLARPLKKARKASSKMAEYKSSKAREPAHGHHPAGRRAAAAARKQTRESIECSRRKSLAACGTQWASGLRRSTRIRTRPLEYWKGERQLYGRIHDSLITVVGTKYFSPAKEGHAGLKVKSYVSDEYKEIVERAALH